MNLQLIKFYQTIVAVFVSFLSALSLVYFKPRRRLALTLVGARSMEGPKMYINLFQNVGKINPNTNIVTIDTQN